MAPDTSAAEFERQYAARSGVTVEWLRQYQVVRPCGPDCDDDECEGWKMVGHGIAADIDNPAKPWAR